MIPQCMNMHCVTHLDHEKTLSMAISPSCYRVREVGHFDALEWRCTSAIEELACQCPLSTMFMRRFVGWYSRECLADRIVGSHKSRVCRKISSLWTWNPPHSSLRRLWCAGIEDA